MNVMQVQSGVTVDQVKAAIDDAALNNKWLVLVFHGIKVAPSVDPANYEYATKDLDAIAAYVQAKQNASQIKAIKMNQGTLTSDTNLLPNATFNEW
jgi:hypothetical protein